MARPRSARTHLLALAQVGADPFLAGIGRVEPRGPLEGTEALGTQVARVTGKARGLVVGAIVGIIVIVVARARAVSLIGDNRAQDADPEPNAETSAKAPPAVLHVGNASTQRAAYRRRGAAHGGGCGSPKGRKRQRRSHWPCNPF